MKKIIPKFAIILLCLILSISLNASDNYYQYETLIDFATYDQLNKDNNLYAETDNKRDEYKNEPLLYPTDDKKIPDFKITYPDMATDNWDIKLYKFDRELPLNNPLTTQKTTVKYTDGNEIEVMKAKIHFPTDNGAVYAVIKPKSEIHIFNKDGEIANMNNGFVYNVRQLESLNMEVLGRNVKRNKMAIRLKDNSGNIKEFPMGYIQDGNWYKMTWINSNFLVIMYPEEYTFFPKYDYGVSEYPLYTRMLPYVKLDSIVIYSDANSLGKSFTVYIKDIKIGYDNFFQKRLLDTDIDDEHFWEMYKKKGKSERERLRKEYAKRLRLEIIESKKGNTIR